MTIPEDLLYTPEHEWVRIEGETAYTGITDFAQRELGEIVFVDITKVGDSLKAGDTFGSIEAVKTVSDMFMPVAGVVECMNEQLNSQPERVNDDPYGEGWIIKIVMADSPDLSGLLTAEQYNTLIG